MAEAVGEPGKAVGAPASGVTQGAAPARAPRNPVAWRQRHHDLRQPLNALGLFCAALRARPLAATEQGLVQGIVDAAAALESMIDAWAADEAGREADALATSARSTEPAADHPAASLAAGTPGPDPARPPGSGPPSPPRILLVDDDAGSRLGTVMLLEAWGAEVVELDGLPALEAWLASDPAPSLPGFAILDFHLGVGGNGLQALARLRAAYPQATVPAVLMTGDEHAAALARGEPDLIALRKPVAPEALLRAIGERVRP